jgi:hypothetical protein
MLGLLGSSAGRGIFTSVDVEPVSFSTASASCSPGLPTLIGPVALSPESIRQIIDKIVHITEGRRLLTVATERDVLAHHRLQDTVGTDAPVVGRNAELV